MDRRALFEQVLSAFRERDPFGEVKPAPAWHDLDPADRIDAALEARRQRILEAAMDREGLSTTARAVLARLGR